MQHSTIESFGFTTKSADTAASSKKPLKSLPQVLDDAMLQHISGGGPKGGWALAVEASVSATSVNGPKGGW